MKLNGSCLCNSVTITIEEVKPAITVCHCHMCQKFFGGPFLSLAGVLPKDVEINGEEQIQRYLSSEWAERGFCKQCGSSLFYHSLADEIDQAKLTTEIIYDQKPAFFHFKEPTEKLTEEAFLQKIFIDSD